MVLDYCIISACNPTIHFKNNEFIFIDGGSSNSSYLYLHKPVKLTPSQSVQCHLGCSMISMKVVNKWNHQILCAIQRTNTSLQIPIVRDKKQSVGSNDNVIWISDGRTGAAGFGIEIVGSLGAAAFG
eukprot:9506548-Ditylum_brightwellii.AAC.1